MFRILISLFTFSILSSAVSYAQDQTIIYKKVDTVSLSMNIYYPDDEELFGALPAMVFFFGGGWKGGDIKQFDPQALYFSKRGIVCIVADYRVSSRHGTTPFESLKDAKSAIRYVRSHAGELRIDPDKIIAAGGSAGGHLAAATALTPGYNENGEDTSISCEPDALVLFNPVIDNGPAGYGYERIGEEYRDFSPLHNIREGAPPTIIFLGTEDHLIPIETAKYYKTAMERVGSRCDLFLFGGQKHGFFNYKNREFYISTVRKMDVFLNSLGYIEGEPEID